MNPMSKRLAFLERMVKNGCHDPFAWYGLAIEYRNLERFEDSLRTFESLRAQFPDYVPMYLICGQMLDRQGRQDEARDWIQAGIRAAGARRDTHAVSELEAALAAL